MKARVLVVGGGVIGTSIALEAAQRTDPLRAPVVLFEKDSIGAGSSGHSGAILRRFYADRELVVMARDSLRSYASFEARVGRSIGFTRSGVLTLAGPSDPEWCDKIREHAASMVELGIDVRVVEGTELRDILPGMWVNRGSVGAWEPGAGFVDPLRTLDGFAALARTYGAVTRLGSCVEEVRVRNGRVTGARTTEGDYTADQIVLVAGPWTGGILSELGVELPFRIVQPENHYLSMPDSWIDPTEEDPGDSSFLSFDTEDPSEKGHDALQPRGLHPVLIDLEYDVYCRCEPETRRSRVGRTDYSRDRVLERPEDRSEEVGDELTSWARETIAKRLPDYADQTDAGSLTSWYTLTPDCQPVIGPVPGIEGLFVAAGFSGHGFKLAPSVGEGMAQMLFDEPVTAFEPEFFAPDRFRGDESFEGRFGL